MHSINISTDQHLHQEREELGPRLRPVPVSNSRHRISNAGANFADRLPQTARQQLPDGSFSLKENNRSLKSSAFKSFRDQIKIWKYF